MSPIAPQKKTDILILSAGEDAENDSDYEEVSPFSRQESSHVSVRNESWAVPVLVIGASFLGTVVQI